MLLKKVWLLLVCAIQCFCTLPLCAEEQIPLVVQVQDSIRTAHSPVFSQLRKTLEEGGFKEIHSLLIYHKGALVFEEYYNGNDDTIDFERGVTRKVSSVPVSWNRNRKHYVASVTKSVTGMLAGIALEQLSIPAHIPIDRLLPPKYVTAFDGVKQIPSLHHILTMTAGFKWDEWSDKDLVSLWQSKDFTDFLLRRPIGRPGEKWVYNSAAPNLLLTALEYKLGMPVQDWGGEHFFEKLGIRDYVWHKQPTGVAEGAARLHMRPYDMLKIGITVLQGGKWHGEQVVPAAWVKTMTAKHATSPAGDYGYYFWLRDLEGVSYISADGDGGQYINIFPDHNMVIVMTQGNYLEWPLYAQQAEVIMIEHIFPALDIR
tara:strand:+ start:355 stop:1470 length:1116 start_codon:yes stop_codon:yes gene_type:complete